MISVKVNTPKLNAKFAASYDTIIKGLNEKQREAIEETEGYIRVIAGAGSEKTKTISLKDPLIE